MCGDSEFYHKLTSTPQRPASPRADGIYISMRVPSVATVEGSYSEMIAVKYIWCFALCSLAVWRVAHLLACESGPWNLASRLRAALDSGVLGRVLNSFFCLSFLLTLPPAIWMSGSWMGFFVQWMALSAVACLLERATQRQHGGLRVSPASTTYLDKVLRGV
jgi:hypothetical protein